MASVLALSSVWMVWTAAIVRLAMVHGVIFFIADMFMMFLGSTIFHLLPPPGGGRAHGVMHRLDHISIHGMTACSYPPICVSVLGGAVSLTVFAILWAAGAKMAEARAHSEDLPRPVS